MSDNVVIIGEYRELNILEETGDQTNADKKGIVSALHTNREILDKYWKEHPIPNPLSINKSVDIVKNAIYYMQSQSVKVTRQAPWKII